jgi:hypothetical protein
MMSDVFPHESYDTNGEVEITRLRVFNLDGSKPDPCGDECRARLYFPGPKRLENSVGASGTDEVSIQSIIYLDPNQIPRKTVYLSVHATDKKLTILL